MWYKKASIILSSLLLSFAGLNAQESNSYPFHSGEKLSYVLNYTWGGIVTDVGSATATLTYEDGLYHVTVTGKTYKFYDIFFKVRERFEASFFETTLRPTYFYRSAEEGKYRMRNTLIFNDSNNTISSRTQKYDRAPFDTLLEKVGGAIDLITLIYSTRTLGAQSLEVGKKVPFRFVIDKEVYKMYYIFKGREVKKVPGAGTYNTLKFAASVVAGNIFTGKDDLYLWVTDDENYIPIFFEAPIKVGKVQGRISTIEGNKYPLTSKIK